MTLKVLIAEDEDDIAQQYKMVLEELGHAPWRKITKTDQIHMT
jgi:DNA-binding response OmpR family regulator